MLLGRHIGAAAVVAGTSNCVSRGSDHDTSSTSVQALLTEPVACQFSGYIHAGASLLGRCHLGWLLSSPSRQQAWGATYLESDSRLSALGLRPSQPTVWPCLCPPASVPARRLGSTGLRPGHWQVLVPLWGPFFKLDSDTPNRPNSTRHDAASCRILSAVASRLQHDDTAARFTFKLPPCLFQSNAPLASAGFFQPCAIGSHCARRHCPWRKANARFMRRLSLLS